MGQGFPLQDISHHHLQLFSHRRRTEMCLTSNLFQTFTIPSEISTTWPTILHKEELLRPPPPPPAGRQQRREAEEGGHDQHRYSPLQQQQPPQLQLLQLLQRLQPQLVQQRQEESQNIT